MEKKKKEYIIFAILGVVFLLFVVRILFKAKTAPPSKTSKMEGKKVSKKLSSRKEQEILQKKSEKFEWKRDPFYLKRYVQKESVKEDQEKSGEKKLNLTGIIWDKEKPLIVISGSILSEGEMYGDYKVGEIKKDKVILIDKGKNKEVILELK